MPAIEVRLDPLETGACGNPGADPGAWDDTPSGRAPRPASLFGAVRTCLAATLEATAAGEAAAADAGASTARARAAGRPQPPREVAASLGDDLEPPSAGGHACLLGLVPHDPDGRRWFPRPRHLRLERPVQPSPGPLAALPYDAAVRDDEIAEADPLPAPAPLPWAATRAARPAGAGGGPAPAACPHWTVRPTGASPQWPALELTAARGLPAPPARRRGGAAAEDDEEDLWVAEELLAEVLAGRPPEFLLLPDRRPAGRPRAGAGGREPAGPGLPADPSADAGPEAVAPARRRRLPDQPRPARRRRLPGGGPEGSAGGGAEPSLRAVRSLRGGVARGTGWRPAGYTAWFEVLATPAYAGGEDGDGAPQPGGARRRARLSFREVPDRPLAALLERVVAAAPASAGFFAYLLTPAVSLSATPPTFAGRAPIALATGRPQWASPWRAAAHRHGPHPRRFGLPAGSVLYFPWGPAEADADSRAAFLRRHWLAACDGPSAGRGHGRALLGVWR